MRSFILVVILAVLATANGQANECEAYGGKCWPAQNLKNCAVPVYYSCGSPGYQVGCCLSNGPPTHPPPPPPLTTECKTNGGQCLSLILSYQCEVPGKFLCGDADNMCCLKRKDQPPTPPPPPPPPPMTECDLNRGQCLPMPKAYECAVPGPYSCGSLGLICCLRRKDTPPPPPPPPPPTSECELNRGQCMPVSSAYDCALPGHYSCFTPGAFCCLQRKDYRPDCEASGVGVCADPGYCPGWAKPFSCANFGQVCCPRL